jgi:hypothetical protein
MRKTILALSIVSLLVWQGSGSFLFNTSRVIAQQQSSQATQPDEMEQKRAAFKSGRDLLRNKVPFDPDILLEEDWREKIIPFINRMPEMAEVRRADIRLKGAQLADTLYLPEKITLTGDTVILVRRLIFESQKTLIKGPHDIHIFPIQPEEVSTIGAARLDREYSPRFSKVGFRGLRASVPLAQSAQPVSVTVDVSGLGRKEWLEAQRRAAAQAQHNSSKARSRRAQHALASTLQTQTANGTPGADGNRGAPATSALQADPLAGHKGADGTCGNSSTVNGGAGQGGGNGGDGGSGNDGRAAMTGGNGGAINYPINSTTGTWWFQAHGGQGGDGGAGSDGAAGAPGGSGGAGGDGADCACGQGGAGNGGPGGAAGSGGDGGSGGNGYVGGQGGNGGTIIVTLPTGFQGVLKMDVAGGVGGQGGAGGSVGGSGGAGDPGLGGHGASNSCNNGTTGGFGANGNPGQPGASAGTAGNSGGSGADGHTSVCYVQPVSPP